MWTRRPLASGVAAVPCSRLQTIGTFWAGSRGDDVDVDIHMHEDEYGCRCMVDSWSMDVNSLCWSSFFPGFGVG